MLTIIAILINIELKQKKAPGFLQQGAFVKPTNLKKHLL